MKREKLCGIYRILCTKNGRYYYGSSIDLMARWNQHKKLLKKNNHHNNILQNHWNKYGELAFVFEIVEHVSKEILKNVEDEYLCKYVGSSNCMNIMTSSNNLPSNTGFAGKYHSEETKKKISIAMKGRKHSEETKQRIGMANIGHAARSGRNHPLYGKKRNEFSKNHPMKKIETRLKNAMAHGSVPVTLISPNGEEFTVINRSEFSRQHNLSRKQLNKVINKLIDNYRGWKLKPVDAK